jgi:hypothetical protein
VVDLLHAWVVVPAAGLLLLGGCGLLAARLAGPAVSRVLVLPMGMAVAIVVSAIATQSDLTSKLAGPAVAVLAVAGFVLAGPVLRRPRERRAWLWPAIAGTGPAAAIAIPVLLTGKPGFTGYGRIVDLAFQFVFSEQLRDAGRAAPAVVSSSYEETISKLLFVGYPGGSQSLNGGLATLTGIDIAWAYQPLMALFAACLGIGLYALLGDLIASRPLRALAATVAGQATILYSYSLAGGIKELSTAAMLVLTVTLLSARPVSETSLPALLPVAVAIVATFAVFNLAVLPWLGIVLLAFFALDMWRRRRAAPVPALGRWVVLGVVAGVLAIPNILQAVKLAPTASVGGPADLGNLAYAVPAWSAAGVWLTPDHRFPLSEAGTTGITHALAIVLALLAVVAIVVAVRRRIVAPLVLGAACLIAILYIVSRAGPWVEFKSYAITAPVVVALAFAGAAAIGTRSRIAGLALALVVTGSILAGNALVYRDTTFANYDRFEELAAIGDRYAGQGPTLYPAFEEYAEYFLRETDPIDLVSAPAGRAPVYSPVARPGTIFARDIDEMAYPYVQSFRLLVLRRDPTGSRPPGNWELAERTRWYDVWRQAAPASTIIRHVPLMQGDSVAETRRACRQVAREARERGARMTYAPFPEVVQVDGNAGTTSPGWVGGPVDYAMKTPGEQRLDLPVPRSGRYEVWVRGSFGRGIDVSVGDRDVGTLRWRESYPGQYEPVGTIELRGGDTHVELQRGGRTVLPGAGNELGTSQFLISLGPTAITPVDARPQTIDVPRDDADRLCSTVRSADWFEVTRADA